MQGFAMGQWVRRLSFGSGAAAEWAGDALRISVTRLRGGKAELAQETLIEDARNRPASAWGADAAAFLRRCGRDGQPVTLVLGWRECAVRTISLPGVRSQDLAAAMELETEGLSPYGDDTASAWMALEPASSVLAAFARRSVIDDHAARFAEAGLPLAGITVPAAAIYRARRVGGVATGSVLASLESGALEAGSDVAIYGESPACPVFWAPVGELNAKSVGMARAQMRSSEVPMQELRELTGVATLAATAAIASSAWGSPVLNLLPVSERASRRPWAAVPALVLAGVLALLLVALGGFDAYRDRMLQRAVEEEIARNMPQAQRAREAERAAAAAAARTESLRQFRHRTQKDLDALQEATRLVAPPGWAQQFDLSRTSVVVSGESEQAAELLKIFDSSALFRNTEFTAPLSRTQNSRGDQFRLRAERKEP